MILFAGKLIDYCYDYFLFLFRVRRNVKRNSYNFAADSKSIRKFLPELI